MAQAGNKGTKILSDNPVPAVPLAPAQTCLHNGPCVSCIYICTGEEIPIPEDSDQKMPGDRPEHPVSTHYHLRGIVVHSGQASGGHYYSFIRMRCVFTYFITSCITRHRYGKREVTIH